MNNNEARNQLCKMTGEIADALGLTTSCTCGQVTGSDVPDAIITEMWKAVCARRDELRRQGRTMNLDKYQLELLAALSRHEGWVSRRDLYFELNADVVRRALEQDPSTLRRRLKEAVYDPVTKMFDHGLVEERTEGSKSYIQLTDKGRKFVKEVIDEDRA